MAKTLQELLTEAQALKTQIHSFLKSATYDQSESLDGLDINYKDPEQLLLLDEFKAITRNLGDAYQAISYLSLPIRSTSVLRPTPDGRYLRTEDGHSYTSGDLIEALVEDEYKDVPYWTISRIEYGPEGYYIYGNKDVSLNGLKVRSRR